MSIDEQMTGGLSLQNLNQERSYLLACLQQEDGQAKSILHKLDRSHERLEKAKSASQTRHIRKQVGWLKSQFEQTTRRGQTLFNRLNQLNIEVDKRMNWYCHKIATFYPQSKPVQPFQADQNQHISQSVLKSLTLDPTSPVFTPGIFDWPESSTQAVEASVTSKEEQTQDGYFPLILQPKPRPKLQISTDGFRGSQLRRRSSLPDIRSIWKDRERPLKSAQS